MPRKGFTSEKAVAIGPYSLAAECNGMVYFSGQTSINPETRMLIDGDFIVQTEQTFTNLFNVLKTAGLNEKDVVKVNVFLKDMNDFDAMNSVYAKQFSSPYPARTTIGVADLPLGARIEIEMIALRS